MQTKSPHISETKPMCFSLADAQDPAYPPVEKRLFNVDEAAAYLGITTGTLYGWVSMRKVAYVKIGRLVKFEKRDLDALIARGRVQERQGSHQ